MVLLLLLLILLLTLFLFNAESNPRCHMCEARTATELQTATVQL